MTSQAVRDVIGERARQSTLEFDGVPADEFDKGNTPNDWVSYITAYAGRAACAGMNSKSGYDFRVNMVKVAALALAAIEAKDKGYL